MVVFLKSQEGLNFTGEGYRLTLRGGGVINPVDDAVFKQALKDFSPNIQDLINKGVIIVSKDGEGEAKANEVLIKKGEGANVKESEIKKRLIIDHDVAEELLREKIAEQAKNLTTKPIEA